jgi:hypothetical protein
MVKQSDFRVLNAAGRKSPWTAAAEAKPATPLWIRSRRSQFPTAKRIAKSQSTAAASHCLAAGVLHTALCPETRPTFPSLNLPPPGVECSLLAPRSSLLPSSTSREIASYLKGNRTVLRGKNRTRGEGSPYFKGRDPVPEGKTFRTSREENPPETLATTVSAEYKTVSKQIQDTFNNEQALPRTATGWRRMP